MRFLSIPVVSYSRIVSLFLVEFVTGPIITRLKAKKSIPENIRG